jgi:hypothetical protein
MSNVKIIISRYNENLNWLEESPFNEFQYIVYNKGFNDEFNKTNVVSIINLPNVGKCDHTYMYHIVENFYNLDDILVFFPGSINIGYKKTRAIELLQRIKNNNFQVGIFIGTYSRNIKEEFSNFVMDSYCTTSLENRENTDCNLTTKADIRPYGSWYIHNLGNTPVQFYTYKGIFSIHKDDILQHEKRRYESLLQQLEVSSNPEVGHYIERSWGAIFYPLKKTKVLLEHKRVFNNSSIIRPIKFTNLLRRPKNLGQYIHQINKKYLFQKYINRNRGRSIIFKNR